MTALDKHKSEICKAVIDLDLTADQIRWHYIHLTLEASGRNVTNTARKLGMHRRTLQRILSKDMPRRNQQVSA